MIDFCLYADPLDGPTQPLISIINSQFLPEKLCISFDEVVCQMNTDKNSVLLMIPPQSGARAPAHEATKKWVDEINFLSTTSVQIVLFVTEIDLVNQHLGHLSQLPNLLVVIPAQHTFGMQHYPWVTWQHWIQDAAIVYQTPGLSSYINSFDPSQIRPKLFDILLGGERPYRTLMHNWVEQDTELSSKTTMTYYGNATLNKPAILEPGLETPTTEQGFHTGIHCRFQGTDTRISVIPPVSVYQQCAYTLVTETTAEHNYVFFTEKIARPIVCQRLFIVLSSYRYLHYLRDAGFQTFGDIINESYDLEVNDQKRWRMAFEQMQNLASMDQQTVLNQIAPIVRHNKKILLETDWNKKMSSQVNQILTARINCLLGI
jgi:hypothetical protein